ncbi:alpha/beta hydrolase [Kineosporia sp. NBRC 101677]|uniref:alpha/beta hydrolase n=1 Tax=Kineosporia sp. NBRC 101677 TaxID=3032197 RepID=UPI0024A0FCCE|nr:alpha/beta fold hydrolase [Kineosporia sp. NBRC 101677]GLY19651.1 alpha/beta hydrolase [Kineosporia sp. NBRC 101677]
MSRSVLFIPGLWIHSSAWTPWLEAFGAAGYDAWTLGWPGEAATAPATRQDPERLAGTGIQELTDHYAAHLKGRDEPPIVVGHSFGGLVAEKLLAAGLAEAAVAIDPAPVRGVRALPIPQIRSALPVLRRRSNLDKAVQLSRRQFRYGFANALSRAEADELYGRYAIPGPGKPIFQLTAAKKDPASPSAVDLDDSRRGSLLIIGGGRDHTVPAVVARQAADLYRPGLNTQYRELPGKGHSLVFDSGWREVCDLVLTHLKEMS